jgi:Mn2+/Fe2+ NRAMP family transporter
MNHLLRLILIGGLSACAVLVIGLGMAHNDSALLGPLHLGVFVLAMVVYLLPTGMALYRDCEKVVWIVALNVFLGWTIAGWFAALGWATAGRVRTLPPHGIPGNPALHTH